MAFQEFAPRLYRGILQNLSKLSSVITLNFEMGAAIPEMDIPLPQALVLSDSFKWKEPVDLKSSPHVVEVYFTDGKKIDGVA